MEYDPSDHLGDENGEEGEPGDGDIDLRILFYRFMQPFLRCIYTQISVGVHLGGSKCINSSNLMLVFGS
jgi:hypothetical protein